MSQFISPFMVELVLRTCEDISTPRSLSVAILTRYCGWDTLVSLECFPSNYLTPESYAKDQAITSLLKKCEDLPTTFDRAAKARENFWAGERGCFIANERLSLLLPEHDSFLRTDSEDALSEFFRRVKKRISKLVGWRPPDLLDGRFGPGATSTDKGALTTPADKMSSRPSLTREVIWYLPQWLGTAWGRTCASTSRDPLFVRGNRFTTVPKNAKTDRGIAAEPSLNVFYQLALGRELRSRLKQSTEVLHLPDEASGWRYSTTRVDLEVAQEVHRQVACDASVNSRFATLDLSNASDSICINLVKLCMPTGWFEALSDLRSPFTLVEGKWVKLEKFSSMGNGYTFELETIIFAALCCEALASCGLPAVLGKDVYVFGDDIIVPTDGVRAVTAVLQFSGLKLNDSKSFSDGPFRESCGGDFFLGKNVRPYHVKEQPKEPQDYIKVANGIRELGDRLRPLGVEDGLRRSWFHTLDQLPSWIRRCRGPRDLGDIVIHDRENSWTIRWRHDVRYIRCYRPARFRKVPYARFNPDVVLACATYGLAWNNGGITPRDAVLGFKVGWAARS